MKYPNLPKTVGESTALAPIAGRAEQVDAKLPGTIKATDEQPNIYLAVEPTQPRAAVFWSHAAPDSSRAPVLIIDYLPQTK